MTMRDNFLCVCEEKILLDRFIDYIDRCLRERYDGSNSVWIEIPNNIYEKTLNIVVSRYTSAGWTVCQHSDKRGGNALEFS